MAIRGQLEVEGRAWNNDEAAAYLGVTSGTLRVWVSQRENTFCPLRSINQISPAGFGPLDGRKSCH